MSAGKNTTPLWKTLKELFSEGGLPAVFIEGLGWSQGNLPVSQVSVDDDVLSLSPIAELKNYWIIEIAGGDIPSPKEQSAIDRKVAELYPERILVFSDGHTHHWRWPRETPSGGVSFETLTVSASSLPSFLAQRLVGLAFDLADFRSGVTLVDVRNRVRGKFDAAKVTKKFFDAFKVQRTKLAESIVGLDSEAEQSSYSTLLLNRLMLLYFLQKREFLNGDPNYLENCLAGVKDLKGDQQFYGFYREVLLPMFFERLASHRHNELEAEIEKLLGDVPYINGGIYEPSDLEKTHGDSLNVPDEAFESIFAFFGAFNWHLDTRPSGLENEINPEVIGYIFEQYINLTTGGKKEKGAYYTPQDVTGYMVSSTVVPRILDDCIDLGMRFSHLVASAPERYLNPDLLHGFSDQSGDWLEVPQALLTVWNEDPIGWDFLDGAEKDPLVQLAGESWVETLYRRERVAKELSELAAGAVDSVNHLISYNLNARLVLTDVIDSIADPTLATELWKRLTSLSVLDPTCGSGAFLFSAMEALEDVYHHLIGVMRDLGANGNISIPVVEEIDRHKNDRYFVRKSIALNNLYGTDLMPEAIETAQLRIFLALVSCLESKDEIEPLPDLNFNLKSGNLVLGLRDFEDVDRYGGDLIARLNLESVKPQLIEYQEKYKKFVDVSKSGAPGASDIIRSELEALTASLRSAANSVFNPLGEGADGVDDDWSSRYLPFHWFIEFPGIIQRGGFDVVIGNPPYVARRNLQNEEKRQLEPYLTGSSPDLYAPCYERSLELTHEAGRHAFIVMHNLAFGQSFGTLREVIGSRNGTEWWSTYGSFAGGLFSGVEVRNTLVVLGPGSGQFSTHHLAFGVESRKFIFSVLEYHASERNGGDRPLRGGLAMRLAEKLKAYDWQACVVGVPMSEESVFLRPTAGYWVPVLPTASPVFDENFAVDSEVDPRLIGLPLLKSEEKKTVLAAIGGKAGYFWWFTIGDNFDVNSHETLAVRALALEGRVRDPLLAENASTVFDAIPSAVVFISHKGVRPNIRWSSLNHVTDAFDRRLLEATGLSSEWRNLNIWYRQAMRSSGPSPKDRIPPSGFENIFTT